MKYLDHCPYRNINWLTRIYNLNPKKHRNFSFVLIPFHVPRNGKKFEKFLVQITRKIRAHTNNHKTKNKKILHQLN